MNQRLGLELGICLIARDLLTNGRTTTPRRRTVPAIGSPRLGGEDCICRLSPKAELKPKTVASIAYLFNSTERSSAYST